MTERDDVSGPAAELGLLAVGINNNTNFLRSMTAGTVDVVAEPIHQGRTQQLWEVRVTDAEGRLVSIGQLRQAHVPQHLTGVAPRPRRATLGRPARRHSP